MAGTVRTGLRASRLSRLAFVAGVAVALPWAVKPAAAGLPETIQAIKPGIVGVGTFQPSDRPPARLRGTGFVVADGRHVVTNAHVLPRELNAGFRESIIIFAGSGEKTSGEKAEVVLVDEVHDLALLRIVQGRLKPLSIGISRQVREGEMYAFTGFPLGPVLGLHPVTHQGIVAAITPLIEPLRSDRPRNPEMMARLKTPFLVFQLDAVAYPGNSGSPLFDPDTGLVVGVINKVVVEGGKEGAIATPTGISYAVPAIHVKELLRRAQLPF